MKGAVARLNTRPPDQGMASTTAEEVAGAGPGGTTDAADPARCPGGVRPTVNFAETWGSVVRIL